MQESGEIKAEENIKWLMKLKEVILNKPELISSKEELGVWILPFAS